MRSTATSGFTRTAADTFTETPTVVIHKPGSVFNNRALAVCRRCNNGWMSAMERKAKPLIVSMMNLTEPEPVVTLTPDQAAILATWAIKTAWMNEESEPGWRATTREMRRALHLNSLPPEYSAVWAARHIGSLDFNIKQAQIQVARHDRPWNSKEVRQVLWTCLTFRGIALLAYTVDGWGVAPPQRDPFRWVPLWPCSTNVQFPPPNSVNDLDVLLSVVNQASQINLPESVRFVCDPLGPQERWRN